MKRSSAKNHSLRIIAFIIVQAFILLLINITYAGNISEAGKSTLAPSVNINEFVFQNTFNQLCLDVSQRIGPEKLISDSNPTFFKTKKNTFNPTEAFVSFFGKYFRKIESFLPGKNITKKILIGTAFNATFFFGVTWIVKLVLISVITISQVVLLLIPIISFIPIGVKVMRIMREKEAGYFPVWSLTTSAAAMTVFSPSIAPIVQEYSQPQISSLESVLQEVISNKDLMPKLHSATNSVVFTKAEQKLINQAGKGIVSLLNKDTGLPVSHIGQAPMKDWLVLYDAAVAVYVLDVLGYTQQADRIVDYVAQRYNKFSPEELIEKADVNGFWGIVKVFEAPFGFEEYGLNKGRLVKGLVTIISNTDTSEKGAAREWKVAPGPIAWMMDAMIERNFEKYRPTIEDLADCLLAIQAPDGGFRGDVSDLERTHTEPHMDAVNVMEKLHKLTNKEVYAFSAKLGFDWFMNKAVNSEKGIIYQGIWYGKPNLIHATDVYTWPLSMVGDRLPKNLVKRLITTVKENSLAEVTYQRGDGKTVTVIGADFTNPTDPEVKKMRDGYNPMVTPEWSSGMALMDDINGIRFWQEGEKIYATELKAMAKALRYFSWQMGFSENNSLYFPYATGKWLETGHGWRTPIGDKSIAGYWLLLSQFMHNPFELNGGNLSSDSVRLPSVTIEQGIKLLRNYLQNPGFNQPIKNYFPEEATMPWISQDVIEKTWDLYVIAEQSRNKDSFQKVINMAQIGVSRWAEQAKQQQKIKEKEIGGAIKYNWGSNDEEAFSAIWRYPLLNEIAALEWIQVASYYQMGDVSNAKKHIKEIILNYSYGQIWDPSGPGFWYPIRSWEWVESKKPLDFKLQKLYFEVLKESGLKGGVPKEIPVKKMKKEFRESKKVKSVQVSVPESQDLDDILRQVNTKQIELGKFGVEITPEIAGNLIFKILQDSHKHKAKIVKERVEVRLNELKKLGISISSDVLMKLMEQVLEKELAQKITTKDRPVERVKTQRAAGEIIAESADGRWSGWGAFSCWKDGDFNLSKAEYLEIKFSEYQAGTKVFVRLLKNASMASQDIGRSSKAYTIPSDGIVRIPIKDFPVSGRDLKSIEQISVHSGSNAWGHRLGQGEDARAVFEQIKVIYSNEHSSIENRDSKTQGYAVQDTATIIDAMLAEINKPLSVSSANASDIDAAVEKKLKELEELGIPITLQLREKVKSEFMKKESPQAETRKKDKNAGEIIAESADGRWSGWGAFSCWKDGDFNLSKAEYLEIKFSEYQAGTKVFVRLLKNASMASQDIGRSSKAYTIPSDGIVRIPIKDFPVSGRDLKSIEQISVHSGSNAWGHRLGQGEDARAVFEQIKVIYSNEHSSIENRDSKTQGYAVQDTATIIDAMLAEINKPLSVSSANASQMQLIHAIDCSI